jgi:hypothetical protein
MPPTAMRSGTRGRSRGAISVASLLLLMVSAGPSRADSDDRARAEALLKPAAPLGPPAVTAEATARAIEALERATRLRMAGDEAHARLAEGLAREWAETARDLGLAAAAEHLAEDRSRQAIQAQAQLERTRALVEEGIARLGRLRAALDAAAPTRRGATGAAVRPDARPKTLPDAAPDPTSKATSAPASAAKGHAP